MRLTRFVDGQGQVFVGVEKSDGTATVCEGDCAGGFRATARSARVERRLAPVAPPNVFCIGLNYREHAKESGAPIPKHPVIFMKPTTAVIGPGDAVCLPRACDPAGEVDYECELAVVIGRGGRDIPEARALEHVFGYTCGNDISARAWQRTLGGGQWVRGKSFDTFCPIGPVLVTADEIPDPQKLAIRTVLNGKVMQNHTTGDMIFGVAQLISFISRDTTLLPGTLILTGTPQGVGFVRQTPVWLRPGDEVTVEIDAIGKLTNRVVGG